MYLVGNADIASYAIGILVGLFFVFAVWFLYKKAYQLQQVNRSEEPDLLFRRPCTLSFNLPATLYPVPTHRAPAMLVVAVLSDTGPPYTRLSHFCTPVTDVSRMPSSACKHTFPLSSPPPLPPLSLPLPPHPLPLSSFLLLLLSFLLLLFLFPLIPPPFLPPCSSDARLSFSKSPAAAPRYPPHSRGSRGFHCRSARSPQSTR